ncbi:hypothetical protein TYRP_022184 [Tyrophagus putrescentiae]|nr:hypothetical protein TYRP_022184 [Tyrophagus putrescentiae]
MTSTVSCPVSKSPSKSVPFAATQRALGDTSVYSPASPAGPSLDEIIKFTCPKSGHCPIDLTSRKNCRRCRVSKALRVGMTFNGENLKQSLNSSSPSSPSSSLSSTSLDGLLNRTITVELQKPTDHHENQLLTTIPNRSKKYATTLNHFEKQCISELQSALAACFLAEHSLPCAGHFASLTEAYNWPAVYSKRVSRFCRSLPAFNALPSFSEQLVILRSAYLYVLSLRAFFAYDHSLGGYYILADEAGTESLFLSASLAEGHYKSEWIEESNRMLRQFQGVMESDEVIRDLLIGFFLFRGSPLYKKCSPQSLELVSYQQQRYLRLLYRYLVHKWANLKVAGEKYSAILKVVETFEELTARSKVLLQEVDVSLFSDLLKEIYEL